MAGGQWEVVGGKSKKQKAKNETSKSSKDKKAKEKSAFESSGPICESQTMFSAFLEKEKREIPKPKVNVSEVVKDKDKDKDKHLQAKKKKDKKSSVVPSKLNFEELLASVTVDDVKNILLCLEQLCPEPNHVWLKDLVSFFNIKFDTSVEDLTFKDKPIGYPCVLLEKNVYDLMLKTFKRFKVHHLEAFFEFCLKNMVQDSLKGINTLGYRVVMQCLAQEMPSLVTETSVLAMCKELCDSHQNRQNICLSVFWAAGQAGNKNLEAGIKVWIRLMFSWLKSNKVCTNFALEYVEALFGSEEFLKCSKSFLPPSDLFLILDSIYSKDLNKNVQKRLLALYPTLKALSYGPKPGDAAQNFFPLYLHRLGSDCSKDLKEELLSSLVFCLEKDNRTYRIWRHIYTKNFIQSKQLIAHINAQWEVFQRKLNKKCLMDTLSAFQITNEEQLNNGKYSSVVKECILVTKELLLKVNTQVFSWFLLIFLFAVTFASLLMFDIWTHGSFENSNVGKFMKDSGLLVILSQAKERLIYYYGKVYKLMQAYIPVAYLWIHKILYPYLELFWKNMAAFSVFLWKCTLGVRTWCNTNVQYALILIDKYFPDYSRKVILMTNNLIILLSSQLKVAGVYLWHSGNLVYQWLHSNAYLASTLDLLQNYSVTLINVLQEYAITFWNFIQSYVS